MVDAENLQAVLDKAAKTVATVTVIVGAFFTVNTGIEAWKQAKVDRYAGFRQAVAAEETYWRSLYGDYLSAFDADTAASSERRRVRLFTVSQMAYRAVPGFEEYDVPAALREEAKGRLTVLRTSLQNAVINPDTSDPELARDLLETSFRDDQAAPTSREIEAGATPRASAGVVDATEGAPATPTVSYQTRILSNGRSEGWDVDVFWCEGEGGDARFARALAAATSLADAATAESHLAPGVRLGRIRLRVLPARLQGTAEYPRLGPIVVRDEGPGEPEAATAIRNRIQGGNPGPYRLIRAVRPTPWYVSVFVCDGEPQAAAPSPARAAA